MSFIDHSSIQRVSEDGGLESITLRSDLAARYTFLTETLLEGCNLIEISSIYKQSVELTDVLQTDKSETELLLEWEQRLREEVAQLEQEQQQQ